MRSVTEEIALALLRREMSTVADRLKKINDGPGGRALALAVMAEATKAVMNALKVADQCLEEKEDHA